MQSKNTKNEKIIKPSQFVYVFWPILKSSFSQVIFLGIIALVAVSIFDASVGLAAVILFVVVSFKILRLIRRWVSYSKLQYVFKQNRIIVKYGGIFSKGQTEVLVKNFTHVTLQTPWLENRLLNTGDIRVESAGSNKTELFFKSVKNPEEIYESIRELMRKNGFKLKKEDLIQQEEPNIIGVLFEVLNQGLAIAFVPLAFTFIVFISVIQSMRIGEIIAAIPVLLWLLLFMGLVFIITKIGIYILDSLNRHYYLYRDTIEYEDGFLDKKYSFIPIENLTDSKTTQTMFEKLLNLYDIVLSCQGAGPEITFRNMGNGLEFDENLDRLIEDYESDGIQVNKEGGIGHEDVSQVEDIDEIKPAKEAETGTNKAQKSKAPRTQIGVTDFTAQLKPKILNVLLVSGIFIIPSILFLPLAPFAAAISIFSVLRFLVTKYYIKKGGFESKMSFLTTQNIKFANDKITSVGVCRGLVDRLLGTCTVSFSSIGSGQQLTFNAIDYDTDLIDNILAKVGIDRDNDFFDNSPSFDILTYLKLQILWIAFVLSGSFISLILGLISSPGFFVLFAFLFSFIVLGLPVSMLVTWVKYSFTKLMFFRDFVWVSKGWLIKTDRFARYENIKDIETAQYLLSDKGKIKLNIAGERIDVQSQQQNTSFQLSGNSAANQSTISNSIKLDYIENISLQDEFIDYILDHRPSLAEMKKIRSHPEEITQKDHTIVKPSILRNVVRYLLVYIILLPTIIGPFIALGLVILSTTKTQYVIQSNRIIKNWGILRSHQFSIIFDRIDHLNYMQGFWGKIFNTGTITVNTTGSSTPELVVRSLPDYMSFYEKLKENYSQKK